MQVTTTPAVPSVALNTQSAESLITQSTLYSANIGGKSYPGQVSQSAGEYVATMSQPPGISATGNTLLAAENNLNTRISVLV